VGASVARHCLAALLLPQGYAMRCSRAAGYDRADGAASRHGLFSVDLKRVRASLVGIGEQAQKVTVSLKGQFARYLLHQSCGSFGENWACRSGPASDTPRNDHSRINGRAAGESSNRPGGLRAGSPPSPPPRLIRPTVRRLPRSPRLSGPGPHRWPTGRYSASAASAGVISVMVWNSPRNSGWFCAR